MKIYVRDSLKEDMSNNYLFSHWIYLFYNPCQFCVCVNVAISWCFHWIKADRRKEMSFNRPDFVCFIPFVLHYPRSLYQTSFYLFRTIRWSADFPLSLTSYEPRTVVTILSQSLLRVQHFSENYLALAWMRQSPKCWRGRSEAQLAERSPWLSG